MPVTLQAKCIALYRQRLLPRYYFVFDFLQLEYNMSRYNFLSYIWIYDLISIITFLKILSYYYFKHYFAPFSLSFSILIMYITSFEIVPLFLDTVFYSYFLCISVLKVSIDLSSSSQILSLPVESARNPIKGPLHFRYNIFNF